ncbi:hypothetical protein V2J09_020523 [Rumex salicifolius]
MLDMADPKFKLFGRTIPFSSDGEEVSGDSIEKVVAEHEADKVFEDEKSIDETSLQIDSFPRIGEDQNTPITIDDNSDSETQKDQESAQGEESKDSQEKTLKKPDKILPCPRCNSMDTKFCYYNNYNVHQPRHFCKSCQRYWTAGGTMRNVPVGAGRRKNKSASSKYCHISISDALQAAHMDLPNGVHQPSLKMNGTVLTFGLDSPLNLAEKKVMNGVVHCKSGENGDDRSSGSSTVTTSGSVEENDGSLKHQATQNINGFPGHHQFPFFPGFQLAYGWNPAIPMPPPPSGFCQSAAFPPIPFYPAPFWNGAPIPWNVPWIQPCSSAPKSTLGKHSRDEDSPNPSNEAEKRSCSSQVLLPKTLRIDNPEEAAKSSIWTTLGIKKAETSGNGGFFKGLQMKGGEKNHKESCPLLNANPAALARSVSFQETA